MKLVSKAPKLLLLEQIGERKGGKLINAFFYNAKGCVTLSASVVSLNQFENHCFPLDKILKLHPGTAFFTVSE